MSASWKLSLMFHGNPSHSRQTDGYSTFQRWSALLHGTRYAAELRKAVHRLLPDPRKKNRPLRCWRLRLLRESQAAQRNTRLALCLEPVQASVAPVSLSSHLAQSHQGAMCLPANLSTLPKYLQSWLQFWKSPEAHTHWRKNSEWIRAWQQRRRSTPRLLSTADQEAPQTRRPCPDAAHSTHLSRIPRSYHVGARALDEGRIGGFDTRCSVRSTECSSLQRRTVATT